MQFISLSTFPLFLPQKGFISYNFEYGPSTFFRTTSDSLLYKISITFFLQHSCVGEARRSCAATKTGGERGIRTLDASFETYMISNHAPSTAQTPLLNASSDRVHHSFSDGVSFTRRRKKETTFFKTFSKNYSCAASCCNAISTSLGASSSIATGSLAPFLAI